MAALTYARMVRGQHTLPELQHMFLHRKRIRVLSKPSERRSKNAHGRACTSKLNQNNQSPLNRHTACNASLPSQPSPIKRWFGGSSRRKNSSAYSSIASASACLPSLLYVAARLFMAVPARQIKPKKN
jgi:hypothetical protein